MFKSNRLNVGLAVGLLVVGVSVLFQTPVFAVAKLSDGPHEFTFAKESDRSYLYTDFRVGYGHVVALETTYTQERHMADWKSIISVKEFNEQELIEFNALAQKYPFLESVNRSLSSTQFLAEKLKTVPAGDAEKINAMVKNILGDLDSFAQGMVVQKGFRIWSVDKPGESVFVPVVDRDANIVISLGPTDLVWKEFKGGDDYPKSAKTVMYSYDFGTKKKISYPLVNHTVVFQAEYHSAVVVMDSVYFYWDLAANKMTKFDSLFKIPANYHQGGESLGSHYLGITLEPKGTYVPNRMLWLDAKTKKTFTAVYPKNMPAFPEWRVYGEFAYTYRHDSETKQFEVWQFNFKNKQFTRLYTTKLNVVNLSLREVDGRNLWFEGLRPNGEAPLSELTTNVIVRFNADKKTVAEWEVPKYGLYQDGAWQNFDVNSKYDPALVNYMYLSSTRGSVVMDTLPKSMTDYIYADVDPVHPTPIRQVMELLQEYRLSQTNLIITKSVLPLIK